MKRPFLLARQGSSDTSGVALIITLMMMAVLTLMVVGLAGVMRNEQAAARNLTYQMFAEQLAQVGAQEAMQAVMANTPTNSPNAVLASGPGWLSAGTNLIPLFQTNRTQGVATNLEAIGNNSLVLSLTAGATGNIVAGWSNIISPVATTNALIGRFSWWVDDEGSKLNLNAVGVGTNTLALLPAGRNLTPFSADFVFLDPFTGATNANEVQMAQRIVVRSNFFPTTESLKDTNITGITNTNPGVSGAVYGRTKGHVTAFSQSADLTPWGTPKFNLSDLTNTTNYPNPQSAAAAVKAYLTTNAWQGVFGPGMSLGRKFGGGALTTVSSNNHGDLVMQQIAANILGAMGRPVVLTNNTDYQSAYGNTDARRHRNGMPLRVASHSVGPYIEEVRTRVDYSISGNGVGSRVSFLVQVVNPYTNNFTNYSLKVQPRKFRFNVQAPANVTVVSGTSSAPLNGDTGPRYNNPIWAGPEWTPPTFIPWNLNSPFISNNLTFAPRSRTAHIFSCTVNLTLSGPAQAVPQAYVILDQVGLYAGGGALTNALRDWVSADDLAQAGNFTAIETGQMNFNGAGGNPAPIGGGAVLPALTAASFGPGNSHGVRKIDPQVRWPLPFWNTVGNNVGQLAGGGWPATAQAWTRSLTMAQTLTNRFLGYLQPDPAPGVTDITNHPHFTPGYYVTNGLTSVAQLGAIHTGIPWRTLRFQPQLPDERQVSNGATNSPPDWILLDLFTVTNPFLTNRPMLNLNSFTLGLAGNRPGPVSVVQGGRSNPPIRTWAVLGALGVWTTNRYNTNLLITNGIPPTATNNLIAYRASLLGLVTNLQAAFVNPGGATVWSSNSAWPLHRSGSTGANLPTYGLGLRGEFLELRGMADDTNNVGEDVIEGRLRPYLDMLSTRSDTFSVWSVGQALASSGNTTNVMAEIRKQTVFRRVPRFAGGQVAGYDLEVVYTRNHTLE